MSKIYNTIKYNSIISSLAILAVLALGTVVFIPTKASAQYEGRYNSYNQPKKVVVVRPTVRSDGATSGTNNVSSDTAGYTVVYEQPMVTYVNTSTKNTSVAAQTTADLKNQNDTATRDEFSDLAANALFGSNSFMPSGLTQWILLAIFILLLVIFVRKTFGAQKEYHATPLKQE